MVWLIHPPSKAGFGNKIGSQSWRCFPPCSSIKILVASRYRSDTRELNFVLGVIRIPWAACFFFLCMGTEGVNPREGNQLTLYKHPKSVEWHDSTIAIVLPRSSQYFCSSDETKYLAPEPKHNSGSASQFSTRLRPPTPPHVLQSSLGAKKNSVSPLYCPRPKLNCSYVKFHLLAFAVAT